MSDRTEPAEEPPITAVPPAETGPPSVDAAGIAGAVRSGRRPPREFDRSIVEGPIRQAVWKLAWPTMLQNVIGGLQGVVDHAMVGHYVGFTGNAAIGVSWQIFLVVVVFVSSLYTGMGVLVARFAGARDRAGVNRTVYQAFLTSVALALLVLAPLGYIFAPALLDLVNATAAVRAEALPYLRIMLVCSVGMLLFFMLGGALRAAGDARTPLRLGVVLTIANVILNVVLIRGLGPIPAFGTAGAALGTVIASGVIGLIGLALLARGSLVVQFTRGMRLLPDRAIIRSLFRFGLPAGFQGVVMNMAGVLLLRFVGSLQNSAEAQAAYAVAYTELFSLVTWSAVGLMGATAAVAGQNLGAGRPDRSAAAVRAASRFGVGIAAAIGILFLTVPRQLLAVFGMTDPVVLELGQQLLAFLSVSGLFVTVALIHTGGLQGTGDTRSPLYISIVAQVLVPIGMLTLLHGTRGLEPSDVWTAILIGHVLRCVLTVLQFNRGRWREIEIGVEPAKP